MKSLKEIVESLQLSKHPEGGFFREYFRSVPDGSDLSYSLAYFLLGTGDISRFHRLHQPEWLFFQQGAPIEVLTLHSNKELRRSQLGGEDRQVSLLVERQTWMAARSLGEYSLISCLVSPAFEFELFELADRQQLLADFPEHHEAIHQFTSGSS